MFLELLATLRTQNALALCSTLDTLYLNSIEMPAGLDMNNIFEPANFKYLQGMVIVGEVLKERTVTESQPTDRPVMSIVN